MKQYKQLACDTRSLSQNCYVQSLMSIINNMLCVMLRLRTLKEFYGSKTLSTALSLHQVGDSNNVDIERNYN